MNDPMEELRKCHYIRPITGSSVPSNMVFVDIATQVIPMPAWQKRQVHTLRLWVACHLRMNKGNVIRETWRYGVHPETFWDFLESCHAKKKITYVFGHNIGHDLSCLDFWTLLEQSRFSLYSRSIKDDSGKQVTISANSLADPPTIIDCLHNDSRSRVMMVDVSNYFPTGLDELSKVTRLQRMQVEDDVDDLNVWIPKVRTDCRIIIETVLTLVRQWQKEKLGNFKLTAAGLSYEAYRARFMNHKLLVHGHKLALELERKCYYGGKIECRFIGQVGTEVWDRDFRMRSLVAVPMPRLHGTIHALDINSMYPAVMRYNIFPARLLGFYPNDKINIGTSQNNRNDCVAWVRISTATDTYPVRVADKVRYCTGRFTTSLCGPELTTALMRGHVIDVLAWCKYEMRPIFKEFIDYFWGKRLEAIESGNEGMRLFYKLILNSLTGKWAQRLPRWVYKPEIMCPKEWGTFYVWDEDHKRLCSSRSVGGHAFRDTNRGEGSQSIPVISAYITAYARERLQQLENIASKGQVYYIDTDSMHVSLTGRDRLALVNELHPTALGKLKTLGVYDYAEYRGVKDYTLDQSHTIAGKKPDSVILQDRSYTQLQRQRLLALLSSRPNGTISVSEVAKRVGLTHINGCVDRYGWVSPTVLKEF